LLEAPNVYPGYQVPFVDKIRHEVNSKTTAVGLIESGKQAEEILRNQRADLIAIGRPLLVNPFWSVNASKSLKVEIDGPGVYKKYWYA